MALISWSKRSPRSPGTRCRRFLAFWDIHARVCFPSSSWLLSCSFVDVTKASLLGVTWQEKRLAFSFRKNQGCRMGLLLLFWLCAACVGYVCAGYPLLLAAVASFNKKPRPLAPFTGSVTILLAAKNEEGN